MGTDQAANKSVLGEEWVVDPSVAGSDPKLTLAPARSIIAEMYGDPARHALAALAPRMARALLKHEWDGHDCICRCPCCGSDVNPTHDEGCVLGKLCDELRAIAAVAST